MRWNKTALCYKSGRFKIYHNTTQNPATWEIYAEEKYIGQAMTLRSAKAIAEDYALGL